MPKVFWILILIWGSSSAYAAQRDVSNKKLKPKTAVIEVANPLPKPAVKAVKPQKIDSGAARLLKPKNETSTVVVKDTKRVRQSQLEFLHAMRAQDYVLAARLAAGLPERSLALGRLHFQKGEFAKAVAYYEQISSAAPEFLRSREELGWAYLRNGQYDKLRGLLPHLNSPRVPFVYRMEGRVLAAYLHILFCEDRSAQNEIVEFQKEARLFMASTEMKKNLDKKSIEEQLDEAIYKMKFAKFEVDDRIFRLAQQKTNPPSRQWISAVERARVSSVSPGALVFPVDAELWSDELFTTRGRAEDQCHGKVM